MRNWGLHSLFCQKGFDKPVGGEQALSPLTTMPVFAPETGFSAAKSRSASPYTLLGTTLSSSPKFFRQSEELRSLFCQKGFDKRAGEQALSPLTTMPVLLRKQDFPP